MPQRETLQAGGGRLLPGSSVETADGIPALLLRGEDDATRPIASTAHASAQLMPNAKLVVYEGAPHGAPTPSG